MEDRENARYIVLGNVNGKKTAIQMDGLYTILPPQNFPPQIPQQIQYNDERFPLYDAKDLIGFFKNKTPQKVSYEKMYRELLVKVKEISDEIMRLKQSLVNSMKQDLAQITRMEIPADSRGFSAILASTKEESSNMTGLMEKVQDGQKLMDEKFNLFKNILEDFKKHEVEILSHINKLKTISSENNADLTKMAASFSVQNLTGQKFQQLVKLQEEVENKLISILFNFGIRLRKEEDPEDESIKRGEEMLNLIQGQGKDAINQVEVDRLLAEFMK